MQSKPTGKGVTGGATTGTTTTEHGGMGGMHDLVMQSVPKHLQGHPLVEHELKQAAFETHNFLGDSGIKVSKICLGTMNFGQMDKTYGERPGQLNEQEAHKVLDRFVELGGNFIDTGNFYPWFGKSVGESEKIIGTWLSKIPRERIILCTKVRYPMNLNDPNSVGLSRNHILESVNESLKRLKTSYIDLLSINGWDEATSISNVLRTLKTLIDHGKVRHIGCVDLKGWQLQTAIDLAKTMHIDQFITVSTEYNLLNCGPELELMDVCRTRHCSLLPYSPLKGGYLSDKITKGMTTVPENTRISSITKDKSNISAMTIPFDEMQTNPAFWSTIELCQKIAKKHNKTVSQVALRWLLQKDVVCSVIIGVRSIQQLEENMGALTFALDCDDMTELDKVSMRNITAVPSPYNMDAVLRLGRSRTYYTPNVTLMSKSTVIAQRGVQQTQGVLKGIGAATSLSGTTKLPSGSVGSEF